MTVEQFLERLEGVKQNGSSWVARCPAHEDRSPSLSVSEGDDGRVLLRCFAGCETTDIVEALGLELRDLMPDDGPFNGRNGSHKARRPKPEPKPPRVFPTFKEALADVERRRGKHSASWVYHNRDGEPIAAAVRWDSEGNKTVLPFQLAAGGWVNTAPPEPRTLYQLPEVLAAGTVLVCEGEKAADAARKLGFTATTSPMGSQVGDKADWSPLAGKTVWILPDNDKPGAKYARVVAERLLGCCPTASSIRIVELPGLPPGGDIVEWIEARPDSTIEELRAELERLAEAAPEWDPIQAGPEEVPEEWPEVIPFTEESLPPFPVDALPPVLAAWVAAEAEATQTPPDLAGMLGLAVLSFCASRRVTVSPWPGWIEPVNLFCCVALPPGSRKSPVFADALAPLREAERVLIERAKPDVARDRSDRRQAEKRLASLEKKAAEGKNPSGSAREAALELAQDLSGWPEPHLPRLLTENATEEKLAMLLADNGRLLSASAEGGGPFDLMGGKYSRNGGEAFGVYLAGFSGDSLTVDRVGRDGVDIPKACLTVAYCIQPSVLRTLGRSETMRGRGLLGRFAWSVPRNGIGSRKVRGEAVPDDIREDYRGLLYALAMDDAKVALELSPEAAAALEGFATELEPEMGEGGTLEPAADWASKAVGLTARLSAVCHIGAMEPGHVVGVETVRAAIALTRYCIPHALKALAMSEGLEHGGGSDARYILRWVKRHGKARFSERDFLQHGRRYFEGRPDDVAAALEELCERGYLRRLENDRPGPGRKPSPEFDTNPVVFQTPEVCTQNSHNGPQRAPEHAGASIL